VGGVCMVASCDPPWAHCSAFDSVCETNTNTDPAHCGACNNACAPGQTCVAGVCQ
jgi:hypothetical protein